MNSLNRHGDVWGSAKQQASVKKAAEASARARRKYNTADVTSGGRAKAAPPAPSKRAAEMVARARGTYQRPEMSKPAWEPGTGKPQTPEAWEAWEHYQKMSAANNAAAREDIPRASREKSRKWLAAPHETVSHISRAEGLAVVRYTHSGNEELNNALRTGETLTREQQEWRGQLDGVLARTKLTAPVTVQRVVTNKAAREAILANLDNPDFRYSESGYTSMELKGTSPSLGEMAERYSGGGGDKVRHDEQIFIEAELPVGTHAFDITQLAGGSGEEMPNSFLRDEHEYLLPRGASWKIERVLPSPGSPAPLIKMTLVRDSPPAGESMAERLKAGVRNRPVNSSYSPANVTSGGAMKKPPSRGAISQTPRDTLSRTGIDEDEVRRRDNLSSNRKAGARKGDALWRSKS